MLRWLAGKGDGAAFAEPETVVMPVESSELRCFPSGGNQAAGPGIIEAARRLAAGAPHAKPAASLQEFLAWPSPAPVATSLMRDVRSQRLTIKSESGLELPAFLLRPSGDIRGVLIAIDDEGKEKLASALPVREMFSKNWAVVGVDPRGIGELKTSQMGWVAAVKHSDINNCA
jgi:hypothetical protein